MEPGRPKILTDNLTIRITPAEREDLELLAKKKGVSLSELGRSLVISSMQGSSSEVRVLLSEVMALRAIFLNALMAHNKGETLPLEEVIHKSEAHKFSMADKRILALQQTQNPEAA